MWTSEWPTERGWYWFFGHMWRPHGTSVPCLRVVLVRWDKAGNPVYTTSNAFVSPAEGGRGYWKRMDEPTEAELGELAERFRSEAR